MTPIKPTTHFGYESVSEEDKPLRVKAVFDSVADRYDLMNDAMSFGLHRLWKKLTLAQARLRLGDCVLDIASGTGDLARGFAKMVGPTGMVVMTDINQAMLTRGRDLTLDQGQILPCALCDAEKLPFPDSFFHCVCVSFGLRNMTHKDIALAEMYRVLKPGGMALILEFSTIWKPLKPIYDAYSFKVVPKLGQWLTKDQASYQYLAESIRMHPDQITLSEMLHEAGFSGVDYHNFTIGVVALHRGYKW